MSIDLQQQIRDNSRDLNVFLRDLKTWTGEVKAKDEALSNGDVPTTAFAAPIRGRVEDPSVKSESDTKATDRQSPVAHNSRPKPRGDPSSTSDKTLGNECFRRGEYAVAVQHYTQSIEREGATCAAYANRAMCGIKLGRWADAEADCTEALRLDSRYPRAHQRRGVARRALGKHLEATMDFERALLLEPTSKILAKERDESKSAFELEANVRPTQARRVVPIEVRESTPVSGEVIKHTRARDELQTKPEAKADMIVDPKEGVSTVDKTEMRHRVEVQRGEISVRPSAETSSERRPKLVVAPRTGAEFERSWKRFRYDADRRFELLRAISPTAIPVIFKNGVPSTAFADVVGACLEGYLRNVFPAAVSMLSALARTPRFDMAVMFVVGSAKRELQVAWDRAMQSARVDEERAELNRLKALYKM